jgi:hypothetical protein
MSPFSTHRRARRRSRGGRIVLFISALVVVALIVGGFTQVGRQSGPYYTSVNRSFSTQADAVVEQSNATGAVLRRLMTTLQDKDRRALQADLDTLTAQADQQAAAADALKEPVSPGDVQGKFVIVFSARAQAVRGFRSALDGLLGMQPLPVAAAPTATVVAKAHPALLSPTQATNRIAAAGALLARADRGYEALRRSLTRLAGHARLPRSKWVTAPNSWQPGPVASQVALVQASPSLRVTHRLVLRVVKVTPPALPPANGVATPNLSVLSPASRVAVQVVLSNLGSVAEPHASVQCTLTPSPSGTAVKVTRTAAVTAAGSVSLAPVSFRVKPGASYQLTVAVILPAGQTDVSGASLSETLQIAPST